MEFLYIEEGTLHGIIAGTPYEMQAGEFYFINSGELHELRAHNHSLHHAIVFDPKFLNFDFMMPASIISSSLFSAEASLSESHFCCHFTKRT